MYTDTCTTVELTCEDSPSVAAWEGLKVLETANILLHMRKIDCYTLNGNLFIEPF